MKSRYCLEEMADAINLCRRLVDAIRDPTTTKEDLTRMVGPSVAQQDLQDGRTRALKALKARAIREGWDPDPELWPSPNDVAHLSFTAASQAFERSYGS